LNLGDFKGYCTQLVYMRYKVAYIHANIGSFMQLQVLVFISLRYKLFPAHNHVKLRDLKTNINQKKSHCFTVFRKEIKKYWLIW
jgi:hypothetical protein